tara:strand:- start:5729 stop:6172 length:444 start_codon:yes stop_codon:yes gene_type:complete
VVGRLCDKGRSHLFELKTCEKGAGELGESVKGLKADFRWPAVGEGMSWVAVAMLHLASRSCARTAPRSRPPRGVAAGLLWYTLAASRADTLRCLVLARLSGGRGQDESGGGAARKRWVRVEARASTTYIKRRREACRCRSRPAAGRR